LYDYGRRRQKRHLPWLNWKCEGIIDIVSAEKLELELEQIVERVAADERTIVSHGGRQVALVSMDDLLFLQQVDEELDRRDVPRVRAILVDPAQSPVPFVRTDAEAVHE
jgi:hypothetical protein